MISKDLIAKIFAIIARAELRRAADFGSTSMRLGSLRGSSSQLMIATRSGKR
jgi:hypothetical protein